MYPLLSQYLDKKASVKSIVDSGLDKLIRSKASIAPSYKDISDAARSVYHKKPSILTMEDVIKIQGGPEGLAKAKANLYAKFGGSDPDLIADDRYWDPATGHVEEYLTHPTGQYMEDLRDGIERDMYSSAFPVRVKQPRPSRLKGHIMAGVTDRLGGVPKSEATTPAAPSVMANIPGGAATLAALLGGGAGIGALVDGGSGALQGLGTGAGAGAGALAGSALGNLLAKQVGAEHADAVRLASVLGSAALGGGAGFLGSRALTKKDKKKDKEDGQEKNASFSAGDPGYGPLLGRYLGLLGGAGLGGFGGATLGYNLGGLPGGAVGGLVGSLLGAGGGWQAGKALTKTDEEKLVDEFNELPEKQRNAVIASLAQQAKSASFAPKDPGVLRTAGLLGAMGAGQVAGGAAGAGIGAGLGLIGGPLGVPIGAASGGVLGALLGGPTGWSMADKLVPAEGAAALEQLNNLTDPQKKALVQILVERAKKEAGDTQTKEAAFAAQTPSVGTLTNRYVGTALGGLLGAGALGGLGLLAGGPLGGMAGASIGSILGTPLGYQVSKRLTKTDEEKLMDPINELPEEQRKALLLSLIEQAKRS